MYIVQPYKVKYWVFCSGINEIYGPYSSIHDFAKYWHYGRHTNYFGTHFYVKRDIDPYDYGKPPYYSDDPCDNNVYGDLILKDEYGSIVHPDDIDKLLYEYSIKIMKEKKRTHMSCYINNRVPGAKRGGAWNMFRSFKNTTRTRRWHKAHDKEYGIKSRNRYIPSTYDDIYKSSIRFDNWKQYRKNQWKEQ